MLQLNMSIHDARTKLDIKDPSLHARLTDSKLEISSSEAKLKIQQPDAIVEINQRAFYEACGLKSVQSRDHENAQKAYNHVIQVIGKMVRDGISLSSHKTTIPNLAKGTMISQPADIELESIPQPSIHIATQDAKVQVQQGSVAIQYQPGKVGGDFQMGTVSLEMVQYPSIKTWVSGSNLDITA